MSWWEGDGALAALRRRGDPEADEQAAAWLAEAGFTRPDRIHDVIARVAAGNDDPVVPATPFLTAPPAPWPAWVDRARVEHGQRVFCRNAVQIGVALFCASLPTTYAAANGVRVLQRTGPMLHRPNARIRETGRMLRAVMAVGGLDPGDAGWRHVRRIRFLHGCVRGLVGPVTPAEEGLPVNQEDLLGTLWTFSLTTVRVLDVLGVHLDEDERDDYLHVWQLVGHLMGIDDAYLPLARPDAEACFLAIQRHQFARSEAGVELTRSLVRAIGRVAPGEYFDRRTENAIRHLVGEDVARHLDLHGEGRIPFLKVTSRLLRAWTRFDQHVPALDRLGLAAYDRILARIPAD